MRLALVHARFQLLETIRIPISVVGSAFFPAAAMIFFVVPYAGNDPRAATLATASMVIFSVMSSNIFQYGVGVAEDRAQPWDPYTRTLATGPGPRFAGRVLAGLTLTYLSLIPVVIIAAVWTEATITVPEFVAAVLTVLVAAVPFTLLGLTIGYWLPSKAAIVVAQVVFFPLAFGGGLLTSPDTEPHFVKLVAPWLPTRGVAELMWSAVGDFHPRPLALVMLAVWVVLLAGLAGWAYRRDEGRRYV
ncbi:ABC transporter permease [Micromonospora auratinigra]|uniref:ABC-2 type transport system permease protein n=1 Tax=Micromonospora auratinigra TaxID=261654 RepID=A0A1A9A2S9_9ACTN|nr:ABC transporter permease [Micromonospora auratinigra]SBT50740.1 ABC-2 type transport system permease protein [Micromonospora auratinigra]